MIIQPTPYCNIDCSYCYLPDRTTTRRISGGTLEKIAERLFESPFVGNELTLVWHEGEPLTLPVSFYEQAHEIFRQHNKTGVDLSFYFQTNGTLISERWCTFFKEQNAKIGISLDGPRHVHDAHRVDRRGKGTHDRVIRGLRLLQAAGIVPTVLTVVTDTSVALPDDLWDFFSDHGVRHVALNPEDVMGTNDASSLHNHAAEHAYRNFLSRIIARGLTGPEQPRLREFEAILEHLATPADEIYSQESVPMASISFDWEGNISTFSPELLTSTRAPYGRFVFGNVFQDSLQDILRDPRFLRVSQEISDGVQLCRESCDYFSICGGGSPTSKLLQNGSFTSTETPSCRLRVKIPTSVITDYLAAEAQPGYLR